MSHCFLVSRFRWVYFFRHSQHCLRDVLLYFQHTKYPTKYKILLNDKLYFSANTIETVNSVDAEELSLEINIMDLCDQQKHVRALLLAEHN